MCYNGKCPAKDIENGLITVEAWGKEAVRRNEELLAKERHMISKYLNAN